MSLEKRLPLALLLSFVVLFGWSWLQGPPAKPNPDGGAVPASGDPANGGPANADPANGDPAIGLGGAPEAESGPVAPGAAPESVPANMAEDGDAALQAAGAAAANEVTSTPTQPSLSARRDAAPWRDWIELGQPGDRGHYFAHFDAAGGSLLELRSGEFWVRRGLTDEEQQQRALRTPLVVPVRHLDGDVVRTKGSLTLSPGSSARGLVPDDLAELNWEHEVLPDGVRFTHETASGLRFFKEFRAEVGAHHLKVTLGIENLSATQPAGRSARFVFTAAEAVPAESADRFYVEPKAVGARVGDDPVEISHDPSGRKGTGTFLTSNRPGDIAFLGGHNKYFAVILRPLDALAARTIQEASSRAVFDGDWVAEHPGSADKGFRFLATDALLELTVPQVGGTASWDYVLYAGPKSADHFSAGDEPFQQILQDDLGFFDGVAAMILKLLRFLHGVFGNWGVAIIVLTLIVRGALFPLNRRMQTSMARHATKMKRIQPKIDAIKERYKEDPKRLREEQAKIIQQEGAIPPLGGCLPLFIQIPVFFGLFSTLKVAFDLRQQPFVGWIHDLAQPDQLAVLGLDLGFFHLQYFNLLPILMVVLWIAQQRVMPKPTDPQALQMHKMMMWMPIVFGLFLYDYAAGLSLYMITSSLFGIAEFTIIRRFWPLDDRELPKKKGGFLAKLAELQEQAQKMQQQQQQQKGPGRGPGKGPGKSSGGGSKK